MNKTTANKGIDVNLKMTLYRKGHEIWRKNNQANHVGFFPIFNPFKDTHLANVSGGALKAYIYFGLHANNTTGECWHSVETMSEYFNVDLRTVKNWVKELEEQGLIARIQKGYKRVANTFILPYYTPAEFLKYELACDWEVFADSSLEDESEVIGEVMFKNILFKIDFDDELDDYLSVSEYGSENDIKLRTSGLSGKFEANGLAIEFSKKDLENKQVWIKLA